MSVYKLQQLQIRREIKRQIKRGIADDELQLIVINAHNTKDFIWQEENEFMYNGVMYDIVRKEYVSNSSVLYYCITDTQETKLFADLDKLVKKKMHKNSTSQNLIKKLLKPLFIDYSKDKNNYKPTLQDFPVMAGWHKHNYQSPAITIQSPPPKLYDLYI